MGSGQLSGLVGWLALTFAAAAVGAVASSGAGSFYEQLILPGWAPPAWVFAPVWAVLYFLMGVAAWLVWEARGFAGARTALVFFLVQLAVNALWPWLFFVLRHGALAFAGIVLLWLLVFGTLVAFRRSQRWAAVLLLPYLAWVSYAGALTWFTWKFNPPVLG